MSEYDPNALNDNDVMPWGRHSGTPLGKIPDDYWKWFLDQSWCDEYPELVDYANAIVEDEE